MQRRLIAYAWVACAAFLGGALRWYLQDLPWMQSSSAWPSAWPWPTLSVNLGGALMIGWYWSHSESADAHPVWFAHRTTVMTGFLGGLTTFSLFSVEFLILLAGAPWIASGYVFATVVGAVIAAAAGLAVGKVTSGP